VKNQPRTHFNTSLLLLFACTNQVLAGLPPAPRQPWSRPAAPAVAAPSTAPKEYSAELARLWTLVNPDAGSDDSLVAAHVEGLAGIEEEFRKAWLAKAMPFLARVVPKQLPPTVVYPFGGVDLVAALATFPHASDITTISLEPAGEPNAMFSGSRKVLAKRLELVRKYAASLLRAAFNRSDNLTNLTDQNVPGPVLFSLMALRIHGYEPVALRYFRISPSGQLVYLSEADAQQAVASGNTHAWDDAEILFKSGSEGGVRVHRHIYMDLSDAWLASNPGTIHYLRSKGKVAAMTKAASYLLWYDTFSIIRKYLLDNMVWMVSDATGIPPHIAQEAGFEQITYGQFSATIFKADAAVAKEFRELWKSQPARSVPFRYGYPDHGTGANQLMVTRPAR
jgi:hypothetical protein